MGAESALLDDCQGFVVYMWVAGVYRWLIGLWSVMYALLESIYQVI